MQWIPCYKCCKDYISKNFPCQLTNRHMCVNVHARVVHRGGKSRANIWYACVSCHSWHDPKEVPVPNSPPFWSLSVSKTYAEMQWGLSAGTVYRSSFLISPFQHLLQLCQHHQQKINTSGHYVMIQLVPINCTPVDLNSHKTNTLQ